MGLEKKAGVARREARALTKTSTDGTNRQETRFIVTIRLRVRKHPSRGDPHTEFVSRGTLLAVLLHELCHLKYMDHGVDFILLLRQVFEEATRIGVFRPDDMFNESPSSFKWENEIFRRGGKISTDELMLIFARQNGRDKTRPSSQCCGGAREQCGDYSGRERSVTPRKRDSGDGSSTPRGARRS